MSDRFRIPMCSVLLLASLIILVVTVGCGSLANIAKRSQDAVGFSHTTPPPVQPAPVQSPQLRGRVSELVAYGRDVLSEIEQVGVGAGSVTVGQAVEGMDAVQSAVGGPVHRIRVPSLDTAQPSVSVSRAIDDLSSRVESYHDDLNAWMNDMSDASRRPGQSSFSVWSGPLWMYVTFGVGGVGTVVAGVWAWIKKRGVEAEKVLWQAAVHQFSPGVAQVVAAIPKKEARVDPGATIARVQQAVKASQEP